MKKHLKLPRPPEPPNDKALAKILRQSGAYYHSAELFYQELWRERLRQLGFRVISIERIRHHPVWDIRLCGNLTVQSHLLVTKPMSKANASSQDPLLSQLKSEVQQIAKELGKPIKREFVNVTRNGRYLRVVFLWPVGQTGQLFPKPKKAEPFSFLIRPWLRKNRN